MGKPELFNVALRVSIFLFEEFSYIDSIFLSRGSVGEVAHIGGENKKIDAGEILFNITSEQAEIYSSQPQIHPRGKFGNLKKHIVQEACGPVKVRKIEAAIMQ